MGKERVRLYTGIYRRVLAWAIYSRFARMSRLREIFSVPVIALYVPYMVQMCKYVTTYYLMTKLVMLLTYAYVVGWTKWLEFFAPMCRVLPFSKIGSISYGHEN